jgi:diguanylate cyclase (GGDEF)-like protein/PAS domain S-box-containing protein
MRTRANLAQAPAAWAILDRLPEAVSVVGPDGAHLHRNAAAAAIIDELSPDHSEWNFVDIPWGLIGADGSPLSNDLLPGEITRRTGEDCSDVEVGFPTASGDVRWLRISSRRFADDGPPFAAIITFTDVTEAHRTSAELRRERERYNAVVESLHEGVVLQDASGQIVSVNTRAEEILGLTGDRLAGGTAHDPRWLSLRDDGSIYERDEHPAALVLATGEPQLDQVMGVRSATGSLRWLQVNATPIHDGNGKLDGVAATFSDVTVRRAEREDLRRAKELFATAFSQAPIGMALVDLDGSWLQVNRSLCDLVGYSEAELMKLTFQDITHPDDLDADLSLLDDTLSGKRANYQMNKRYLHADGRVIWVLLSVSLVSDEGGMPLHFVSQIQDVTERRGLEERLQQLADRDGLTGLLNRRRLEEELRHQLARCVRHGEQAALMIIDLDGFKAVNDTFGHAAGDVVLRDVAAALGRRSRDSDTLARLGGDEFAAIVVNVTEEQAHLVATQLAHAADIEGAAHRVTASVGLATLTATDTVDGALARADKAMYEAKRNRELAAPAA